jgi:DNA polymerase/3'-5' exonuclease PolX
MDYYDAANLAVAVKKRLESACERIEVAGSVRRRAPYCKDVEIVFIPKFIMAGQTSFLGDGQLVSAVEQRVRQLVRSGFWRFDHEIKRNGPKYKRMKVGSHVVELFSATPDNWGYIYTIRTGPASFNKKLVTPKSKGGYKPGDIKLKDGVVSRLGGELSIPDEKTLFELWGLPWKEPEDR